MYEDHCSKPNRRNTQERKRTKTGQIARVHGLRYVRTIVAVTIAKSHKETKNGYQD